MKKAKNVKNTLYALICVALMAVVCGSCTQNGGHIGKIFGRWYVESIETDGLTLPAYDHAIYWAFQSDVIQMQRDNGEHDFSTVFGTYRIDDNTLFLDFPEAGRVPYAETGLPIQSELQILDFTAKRLIVKYDAPAGGTVTYRLRKW